MLSRKEQHDRRLERPWSARRGIHGPKHFKSLLGAQGWADEHWPEGEVEIVNRVTGTRAVTRREGNWLSAEGDKELAEEPAEGPWWTRC
jgi:hypothetical protein